MSDTNKKRGTTSENGSSGFDETVQYVRSFIKDKQVASVTPTSGAAVRQICDSIDFRKDVIIVEYGAGTGVFTEEILSRMTPGSKLIAFETNAELADLLRGINDKRLIVSNRSAEDVDAVCRACGLADVDYILSGIPFSFLKPKQRINVIITSRNLLKSDGMFIVYQASWAMKATILKVFGNCETDNVLLNLPPLFIMMAKKDD